MSICEICGKEAENTWKIELGNSKLTACKNCKEHGRTIKKEIKKRKKTGKKEEKKTKRKKRKELVDNYGKIIKKKREKEKLTQKQLSNKIKEKESRIRKIENEKIMPSEKTVRKLEKTLNIELYQEPAKFKGYKRKKDKKKRKTTIGDIIKLKEK